MARVDEVIGYGTHATRPAAGSAGRLYYETDTDTIFRDNGSTWDMLTLGASTSFVGARYSTAAGQSIPNATDTIINFGTVDYDTDLAVTVGASWKFTAPGAGYYSIKAAVMLAAVSWPALSPVALSLYKNGSLFSSFGRTATAGGSANIAVWGTDDIHLGAGDYVDVRLYQQQGGSVALYADSIYNFIAIGKKG